MWLLGTSDLVQQRSENVENIKKKKKKDLKTG